MCKKKRSSASRRKQPPSTTAVGETSQPLTPAVEPLDPVIKDAISRAVTALKSGEHEKALDFIEESISCHPLTGYLHHVEGMVHKGLADSADKDSDAKVKHLEDGVFSCQLAVELLPNSIRCGSLLADLVHSLALFDQRWDRVIEVCKCTLKIENTTDSGVAELFGEDISDESRIENEKQAMMIWLQAAERKNLESVVKKAVEEKEVSEININNVVAAMERRKKQFRAVTRVCSALKQKTIAKRKKRFDGGGEKIAEYKRFWSGPLSDDMKRGFQKVNIEELAKHLKSLECQLTMDQLSQAIDFAKEKETLKFWECYVCVKKFNDYASYRHHFWEEHWMDTAWKLASDLDIESKSVNMIANCVWKPVDTAEATKIIVNLMKSESCSSSDSGLGKKKGLDEGKSSSVGEIPGKTSVDDLKWEFCDDTECAELLVRIRGMFEVLLKNNCLASSHVRWAMEYTKDQFESTIQLSQFRDHSLETPQIICCLGASQLTEVLEFLATVAHNCGVSEDAEIKSSMDDKLSGDFFTERIDFNQDCSCFLWQELQGEAYDTDNIDAVEDDGSAIILALDSACEAEVFSNSYDIVSWLHVGSDVGEILGSWTSLRDFQKGQAIKFLKMFDEELLYVSKLCDGHIKISSMLKATQMIGSMIVEEIKQMEKSPEHETQHFFDLLRKRREEIEEIDDISLEFEIAVISNVLEDALIILGSDDSESEEELYVEDEWKQADEAIKIALRQLKMQLLKDLSLVDAIILRSLATLGQYERELASISVYDYRSILVPMMKSFLQSYLNDLYEDANKKAKAAEEALLSEVALEEAENKISKDSDDMKQKQKKKKKKKKNKNSSKAEEPEANIKNKHTELQQKVEQQDTDSPDAKNEGSLDEPKELTMSDEERMLDEYLKKQKQFEDEASLNVNLPTNEEDVVSGE